MTGKVSSPPIYEKLVNQDGKPNLAWILFFNKIFQGDSGTDWTPTFTSLTTVGTPTITGRIYKLSGALAFFRVHIVPSTSTTSVAGTTYIDNMPVTATANGICFAVSGLLGTNAGMYDSATNRVYVPAWSAVTVPLTIIGICEAR